MPIDFIGETKIFPENVKKIDHVHLGIFTRSLFFFSNWRSFASVPFAMVGMELPKIESKKVSRNLSMIKEPTKLMDLIDNIASIAQQVKSWPSDLKPCG